MLLQPLQDISVIITNHNYSHYLSIAIESVLKQTLEPSSIIVIDDNSTDNSQEICESYNIPYHKVYYNDPNLARHEGYNLTQSSHVCFLDADDYLKEDYLEQGQKINSDIVYSDMQLFGNDEKLIQYPENIHPSRISQANYFHVGCLVSREAIDFSHAFSHPPLSHYDEDWMFWRKIVSKGFSFQKQQSIYYARKHNTNRSLNLSTRSYYDRRGIAKSTITTVSPKKLNYFEHITTNLTGFQLLNYASRRANTDYTYFTSDGSDRIDSLLRGFDHDVAIVQSKNHGFLECTMLVSSIFRDLVAVDYNQLIKKLGAERKIVHV